MIKLERIHVENYKNIEQADLPLGQMNVIVGENNAGKSNLLGLIPIINYIINGPISNVKEGFNMGGLFPSYKEQIWNKYLPVSLKQQTLKVSIDFINSITDIIYSYEISFGAVHIKSKTSDKESFIDISNDTRIVEENFTYKSKTKTGKAITIFKRKNTEVVYGDGIKKADAIISNIDDYSSVIRLLNLIKTSKNISKEYKEALISFDSIFNSNIYYLSSQFLLNKDFDLPDSNRIVSFDLSKEIYSLYISKRWKDYLNALEKILLITKVYVSDYRKISPKMGFYVSVTQNDLVKSVTELSDGSIVLLALITKIFSDTSDIIFIEEPENSIHPRALGELMKLIREQSLDKQFIITTHSSYLLNMIKPEEVLVAEKQDNGLSKIGRLPNIKAIKKKLSKGFMDFGDIVFEEPIIKSDSE